jgi:hypothetical protein
MKKLKYRILLRQCDLWGRKPWKYTIRWNRNGNTRHIVATGFVYAKTRENALKECNRRLDLHRELYDGHLNYYAQMYHTKHYRESQKLHQLTYCKQCNYHCGFDHVHPCKECSTVDFMYGIAGTTSELAKFVKDKGLHQ